MSQQCGGNAGYGSDCWLDPRFWDRNKLYFLDSTVELTSRNTVPLLCQGQISHGIWNDLVCADSQHPSKCVYSPGFNPITEAYAQAPWDSFMRSFRKPTIYVSPNLTSLSGLSAKPSRMTYYQQKLTKLCYERLWLLGYVNESMKCGHGISISEGV